MKSENEVAQSCPTLSDPLDCSLPGSSVHGIFQARVLEWGAIACSIYTVQFSSVQFSSVAQSCPTLCDPIDGSPPRLPRSWNSPGKNAGVGCHFLLQCRKVKSESKVAQSCLTLPDPTDCSLQVSSIHGIFQARVLEWGAIAFSLEPTRLPRPWDYPGKNTGVGCHFLLQCRKVKSENEVAQSCPTLRDPMDCSLPGFSVRGIFQAKVLPCVK